MKLCVFWNYQAFFLLVSLPCAISADDHFSVTLSLKDGTTTKSNLDWTSEKCFRVTGNKPISIDDVTAIRFPDKPNIPLRVPLLFEFQLVDRQLLFGVPLGFEEDNLVIRTAWSDRVLVPRSGIVSIRHASGRQPIWVDDFENDLADWTTKGNPRCREGESTSGKQSLSLASSQSAARLLKQTIKTGQFGVNFLDPGPAAGQRCWLEMEFQSEGKEIPKPLRVQLSGDRDSYLVEAPGQAEPVGPIRRTPGWHRLTIEFDTDHILVLVDDWVLRSATGSPGALKTVRLMNEGTGKGESLFDDAALHSTAKSPNESFPIDLTQDGLQRTNGEEWYGKLTQIGPRFATFENKLGSRKLAWTEIQSISFRCGPVACKTLVGEQIHLLIRTNDGLRDALDGVVSTLDARELRLQHSILGECVIPLSRVHEIRPRYFGSFITIDHQPRHLGEKELASFAVPKPEGVAFTKRFTLEPIRETPTLSVSVRFLVGAGDGETVSEALKQNGLQTEVWLNAKRITDLNQRVNRSTSELRVLRIPISKTLFSAGENILGLRQTPDRGSGRFADCEIRSISLELPRPRP